VTTVSDFSSSIEEDYSLVNSTARIAVYDDLLSSPKIIDIEPSDTKTYIGNLAATIYSEAKSLGGSIPYAVILQVAQNFIHAYFCEIVVSILDKGNTIRFSDQGPGIPDKEKAKQPGYSSATSQMKKYIDGVGSGLPIVKEYLETKHGIISIEDNINRGSVITISLNSPKTEEFNNLTTPTLNEPLIQNTPVYKEIKEPQFQQVPKEMLIVSSISKRGRELLTFFDRDSVWGVQDLATASNIPMSSTFNELKKLEDLGLIKFIGKKRALTQQGCEVLKFIN
jgi:hypothetical protein